MPTLRRHPSRRLHIPPQAAGDRSHSRTDVRSDAECRVLVIIVVWTSCNGSNGREGGIAHREVARRAGFSTPRSDGRATGGFGAGRPSSCGLPAPTRESDLDGCGIRRGSPRVRLGGAASRVVAARGSRSAAAPALRAPRAQRSVRWRRPLDDVDRARTRLRARRVARGYARSPRGVPRPRNRSRRVGVGDPRRGALGRCAARHPVDVRAPPESAHER